MPARRLSDIVPRIEAAPDRAALDACVAEGLAAFDIPVEVMHQSDCVPDLDAERLAWANIILALARLRARALPDADCAASAQLPDARLTGRQLEILDWAAAGKSNGDIATIMGKSRRAIDYHMSQILRKLHVTSRSQAIARAARQ